MRYVNCLIFSYVGAECSFSVPDIFEKTVKKSK